MPFHDGKQRGRGVLVSEELRLAILAPIDDSVGIDGRAEEGEAADLLRDLRSDRKALVRLEQSAAMGDDVAVAEGIRDWPDLAEAAADYLSRYSKDLEPMAILIEAATRSDDPADLAEAMTLLARLVETFWEQGLYPVEDEDDGVESRFQPLSGLSGGGQDKEGALILPLRRMKLAEGGGDTLRFLDKVRADAAMAASQTLSGDQKAARVDEATALYASIDKVSRSAPGAAIERAWNALSVAGQGWRDAIAFISERTKPQLPAASRLSQEFSDLCAWLNGFRPKDIPGGAADEQAQQEDGAAEEGASGSDAAGPFMTGKITRREDALRAISAAEQYFAVYEPLSPLGVTLREVDRRARMSLDDLLIELIPSESARTEFYWRSGIRPPSGSSDKGSGDSD